MDTSVWLLFVVLGVLALHELGRIARSLQGTEAMLMRWLAHQGIDWQAAVEPSDHVEALASDRKTYVAAIRAYRQQTGLGLKEAKAVVDALAPGRRGVA